MKASQYKVALFVITSTLVFALGAHASTNNFPAPCEVTTGETDSEGNWCYENQYDVIVYGLNTNDGTLTGINLNLKCYGSQQSAVAALAAARSAGICK